MNIKRGDIISNTNFVGGNFYLCYNNEWRPCNFSREKQLYYVIKIKHDGYGVQTLELMNMFECNNSVRVSGPISDWDNTFEHVVKS